MGLVKGAPLRSRRSLHRRSAGSAPVGAAGKATVTRPFLPDPSCGQGGSDPTRTGPGSDRASVHALGAGRSRNSDATRRRWTRGSSWPYFSRNLLQNCSTRVVTGRGGPLRPLPVLPDAERPARRCGPGDAVSFPPAQSRKQSARSMESKKTCVDFVVHLSVALRPSGLPRLACQPCLAILAWMSCHPAVPFLSAPCLFRSDMRFLRRVVQPLHALSDYLHRPLQNYR